MYSTYFEKIPSRELSQNPVSSVRNFLLCFPHFQHFTTREASAEERTNQKTNSERYERAGPTSQLNLGSDYRCSLDHSVVCFVAIVHPLDDVEDQSLQAVYGG